MPPDLSQDPFDVDQTISGSEDTPRVPTFSRSSVSRICWGAQIGLPAQPSSGLLAASYSRDQAISAALQLQRDAGLIMSNLQVPGQFVTSLNRMSSEVMRLAFGHEPYPSEAVQSVAPSPRVRRAAHYMAVMGLWRPPGSQGALGICRPRPARHA